MAKPFPEHTLLTRYWFKTKTGLGFGVTAFSLEDAKALVAERARELQREYEILEIVENVDIRELDQGHVVPNMNPPNLRGVWFPMQALR
jgi:hypothetical protein